ncbi:MAG: phage tail sheath C-terminal domain-containing protein [Bacteroidota bacterium]
MSYFKTPGVYIKEQDAFGSSVVAVPTAVPAFIGYTQKAEVDGNSLLMKPTKVRSLAEAREIFGGGNRTTFKVTDTGDVPELAVDEATRYYTYSSLRLFWANGGGEAYIISIGDYSESIDSEKMLQALEVLTKEQEPTIIVIPDAVLLPKDDCYSVYKAILQHCGAKMKSRVGLVDVWGGHDPKVKDAMVKEFREGIGSNSLAYSAVYFPWLHTTITPASEVDFRNVSNRGDLVKILMSDIKRAMGIGGGGANPDAAAAEKLIASITKDNHDDVFKKLGGLGKFTKSKEKDAAKQKADYKKQAAALFSSEPADDSPEARKIKQIEEVVNQVANDNADIKQVGATISALSPIYKTILKNIRTELNVLPPSGAMAGVYALVDNQEGVHKAPANVSLSAVVKPTINITADDQEDLNSPLSGKAINAIRSFVGKGVLVWGARSMDANSQDWRYISVRRTMIMIEQSIKNSVEAYVFEPNTARTWLKLRTSIQNFLTEVWKAGSLAGATPSQAFEVHVGLGSTMTPNDILEGVMRISVKVAITRPAEFIEITFEQKMQES